MAAVEVVGEEGGAGDDNNDGDEGEVKLRSGGATNLSQIK